MTLETRTGRPKAGYHLADGTAVPGVTSILNRFKESGALMHWAFQQGKAGKAKLYEDAEKAADIGTYVHELVRAWSRNLPFPATPLDEDGTTKAMTAFDAFRSWAAQSRLEIVESETPYVSALHRFGGTPDAIGRMDGALYLLDYKVSNGVYVDYLLQLSAYQHLWEDAHPGEHLHGFHLLRFGKEHGDFAHHHFPNLDEAWRLFLLYREAYELDKQLKKRV